MTIEWSQEAWEDYLYWQQHDRKMLKKINSLLEDIGRGDPHEGIGKPEPLKEGGLDGGNALAVKDLLSAIENDRQPECNVHEGRITVEMITAVFESHRLGGPVTFPLKTRENPLSLL